MPSNAKLAYSPKDYSEREAACFLGSSVTDNTVHADAVGSACQEGSRWFDNMDDYISQSMALSTR